MCRVRFGEVPVQRLLQTVVLPFLHILPALALALLIGVSVGPGLEVTGRVLGDVQRAPVAPTDLAAQLRLRKKRVDVEHHSLPSSSSTQSSGGIHDSGSPWSVPVPSLSCVFSSWVSCPWMSQSLGVLVSPLPMVGSQTVRLLHSISPRLKLENDLRRVLPVAVMTLTTFSD